MLDISEEDYKGWEPSDNQQFVGEIMYFFEKTVLLVPRYLEDAKEAEVVLYIKLTWQSWNGYLVVLSFHQNALYD